ncbi:MAG: ABC transporter ATP-binding protein [Sulfolobales archaeon]|nr:ABC transporter ATP-binding protein [Sulfolobales archaeon]
MRPAGGSPLIELKDVKVYFKKGSIFGKRKLIKALDGVSMKVDFKEKVAIVGETGSGKTTLGRVVVGLQRPTSGEVVAYFNGQPVNPYSLKGRARKEYFKNAGMVYQDPYSAIDPLMRVRDVLRIPLIYAGVKGEEAEKRIKEVMSRVSLSEEYLSYYVFQLSGGQRQRLVIARALLFNPKLLVADEPVSMLDASLKGDILDLLNSVNSDMGVSVLMVTHELAVAKVFAQRIHVLYLGKIMESANSEEFFSNPLHPYTQLLLAASPDLKHLRTIPEIPLKKVSEIPSSANIPPGCRFHTRCPFAFDKCIKEEPPLKEVKEGHEVACWLR